jgi:hypothetical protein
VFPLVYQNLTETLSLCKRADKKTSDDRFVNHVNWKLGTRTDSQSETFDFVSFYIGFAERQMCDYALLNCPYPLNVPS